MSFSAFLTGTVLVSSLALGGMLAPHRVRPQVGAMMAGGVLVAAGFLGGLLLAT